MSTLYAKCPFLKSGCVECPIYRGRHCFVIPMNGRARPLPSREEDAGWKEGLIDFFSELEEQSHRCIDFYAESV